MLIEYIAFAVLGSLAGLLSGLLGIGGGLITVPGLFLVFEHMGFPSNSIMHFVAATSLCCVIPTVGVSTYQFNKQNLVDWNKVLKIVPGMVLGIIIGSLWATHIRSRYLEILLGIFLIVIAIRFYFPNNKEAAKAFLPTSAGFLVGAVTGILCGMLGLGGSVFLIPFLTYFSLPIQRASGTSSACLLVPAIFGSLTFVLSGLHVTQDIPGATGFIYWPAVLSVVIFSAPFAKVGVKLASALPVKVLKRIFSAILVLSAINLMM